METMRPKPDLQLRKIGSQYMIVDTCHGSVNMTKVFELNETAARIWQWLGEQALDVEGLADKLCEEYEVGKEQALDVEGLADKLCEEYEVGKEQARKDVNRQLEEWKKLGLVQ